MKNISRNNAFGVFTLRSIVAFLFIITGSAIAATAQSVTLTTTVDENNGNTGSIALLQATPGGAGISLREAILAANNEPNGSVVTITMPAGTYTVTIAGTNENLGVNGDIDVNVSASAGMKTVTINGAGSGSTVISGAGLGERVFDVHAVSNPGSITFNLSGVTISGASIASAAGGAMLLGRAGDITNISNCVFSGNSAPNSGAISQSSALTAHDLTITNSSFINNTATSGGPGAVNYNGVGNVSITGCTFSGNTAATQGGAINITGGGSGPVTTNILRNTFLNNTANGTQFGGAVLASTNAQTININFNRFVGNTSPNLNTTLSPNFGDGRVITASGGTITTFNADNNWWGVNTGPVTTATSRSLFGATAAGWLQLRNVASPATINFGGTSTLTADILGLSTGGSTAASNLTGLPTFPAASSTIFGNPVRGTLSATSGQFVNGVANLTPTFTANAVGAGSADATADSQTATAAITINQATTSAAVTSSANPAFNQQSITFTATVGVVLGAGTPTGTVSFRDNGVNIPSCAAQAMSGNQATCVISTLTSGTHPITVVYNGSANFAASPASSPPLQQVVTVLTAAGVTVGGRVSNWEGRSVRGTVVTMTDQNGVVRQTNTDAQGFYSFDNVETGQTYVIGVRSRRLTFSPQVVSVTDNLTGIDFIGQ